MTVAIVVILGWSAFLLVATVRLILRPPRYDNASVDQKEIAFADSAERRFGDASPVWWEKLRGAKRRWKVVLAVSGAWAATHYLWYWIAPSAYRSFWWPMQRHIEPSTWPGGGVFLFVMLPVLLAWHVLWFLEWDEFARGKDYGGKWPNPPW